MIAFVAFALPLVFFLALWWLLYHPLSGIAGVLKAAAVHTSTRVGKSAFGKRLVGHSKWQGVRAYAPMVLVLLVGGALAVVAGELFIDLAQAIRPPASSLNHFDRLVHDWLAQARRPGFTLLLSAVTLAGGFAGMATIVLAVTSLLFARKQPASALFLLITAVGGMLLNTGLKMRFARARPDLASAISVAKWYSFPSGHAMVSFIVFAALCYLSVRQKWSWKATSACIAGAFTLVVLIGLSRVYLGVHWISDIAGGWTAALVWVATTTVAYEMLLAQRRRRGQAAPRTPEAIP